jgi:transcriptional regulator with XRE-family HTH domain
MIIYNPSKIKKLLKDKKTNANQLARILNTDRQKVYAWLAGKQPQADSLMNICSHFNLAITYFFTDNNNSTNN